MKTARCPNCSGTELYRTVVATPANGLLGPNLLPKLQTGKLDVVVCEACGLTQFFTRQFDIQTLKASDAWTRVGDPDSPLGLKEP